MDDLSETLINSVEIDPQIEPAEEHSINTDYIISETRKEEEKLLKKLKFFFMNPVEKWTYKQRVPYKCLVQIVKIIFVTLHVYMFANQRCHYVNFFWSSKIAFSQLFLQGWESSEKGDLVIYRASEFFSTIDFAAKGYANLDKAIGSYSYDENHNNIQPIQFCYDRYKVCDVFGFNESFTFNTELERNCVLINITKEESDNFSIEEYFHQQNISIKFSCFFMGYLSFQIKTISTNLALSKPDCYRFNLTINLDNQVQDGKIRVTLDIITYKLDCNGKTSYINNSTETMRLHDIFNSFVTFFSVLSTALCIRAIYKAQILRHKTAVFMRKHKGMVLSLKGHLEFLDLWYLTMIFNDIILIISSILYLQIEVQEFSGDKWNICCVLLGVGTLLAWTSILRYLCYFENYNIVILTLKYAFPVIFRFLFCSLLIFTGFMFCGFLIFSPYHFKFRTLALTAQNLYSLMNGDDIFETFISVQPTQSSLVLYSFNIYMYLFVTLFIYVVLSLFMSVILDAYEAIKRYRREGFPKTEIQEFMELLEHDQTNIICESSSSLFPFPSNNCDTDSFSFKHFLCLFCCCRKAERHIN